MQTLVVIQSRFNSSRLPGKALWPLAGLPLLAFLIRRLKAGLPASEYRLVLATTDLAADDILAAWAEAEGIAVVRGDEQDLVRRFNACLKQFPADFVVRVTADNPLTCPQTLKQLVASARQHRADYAYCPNLPVGAGVDVFGAQTLELLSRAAAPDEREHLNLHILNHPEDFCSIFPEALGPLARPELRLTIDTLEDWRRVRALCAADDPEPWNLSLHAAISRLDNRTLR